MRSEFELIERLKKQIPKNLQGLIPIGDDAGALRFARNKMVWVSVDAVVDGVDFRIGKIRPEEAGRKALAVSLSDMAAMGARPVAFVAAVGIPNGLSGAWLLRFQRGMVTLAKKYSVACLGGDISRAKQFFASVTILGEAVSSRAILRKGARPGDWIAVTGALGGSILRHHYGFEPRVAEGRFLAERFRPHAMIDISDGLLQDLGHLLKASKAGAEIEWDRIPVSGDARILSRKDKRCVYEHALTDGEDFELLFTVPPAVRKKLAREWKRRFPRVRLSWIGRMTGAAGQVRWLKNGRPVSAPRLKKTGFKHF